MDKPSELNHRKRLSRLLKTVPPFVGRSQELDWLEHCLQEASAGRPHVILIPGQAGIGKTRLLQEVRSDALRRGLQVFYGRGYEDLTLPYLPFVEVLRALVDFPFQDIEHAVRADVEVINSLLHANGMTSPPASPSTSVQSRQDELKLLLAVSRVMIALVQRRPTLFVVDDLHWADRPSLDLFGHLVFTAADMAMYEPVPLLLIGTYRPVEPEEPLARLIARLQRETIGQTLTLSGLNESEIYELVQGMSLLRPSHQLIATISEATQGNPLFVQEVLHHLIRQDALEERGGSVVATAAAADLPLPTQVTSAIVARLGGLSEGCRRVLTLASFLGESFSFQTLGAVSGLSEDELLNLLEEGIRQHLLRSEGHTFQFAHSLIRHVFYHEPSAARRQRIHRQIGETLQRLYAESVDAHVLEIAHHLVRAGQAADMETVAAYARQAGDRAFTAFAWGEAAHYYEAALSAAEATGQLSPHDRAELHYWAGLAHYRDQDAGPSLEQYAKAIEAYRLTGDICGLAQALMDKTRIHCSLASVPFGTLADVVPLEEILETLGDNEPELRGRISSVLSGAHWVARQADKAEWLAQRALELGQRLRDDRLCALAGSQLGLAQLQDLRAREGVESWRNAVTYARQADDLWLQSMPLSRMPQALIALGRLDEAEAVGLSACELTRKTYAWGDHSFASAVLASVAVARGDFATAERRAHEALLMMSRSGYSWSGALALPTLACARALRGTYAEANDALDLLVEPGRVFAEVGSAFRALARAFRQLVRGYAGAYDDVRREQAASSDLDVAKEPVDFSSLAGFCALAEMADFVGAPAMAERAYQPLLLAAGQGMLFPSRWIVLIPRVLGVAATVNRWWDTAEAHFQEAIKTATRIATRPELGRSYLDYARMLIARGRKHDRRRAMELVRQASPLFHELGMEPFARRAAQLAEALQTRIPTPARPRTAYPAHLSEREIQILGQIAQGCTNQEIADALVLSPTTVARHEGGLFRKIGVNSRSAATAYAFDQGLIAQLPPARRTATTSGLDRIAGTDEPPRTLIPPSQAQPLHIILVTDMEGSTALIQRWGDAQAYELLGLHNAIIRDCLRRHQGTEVIHTGDGIEASFFSAANAIACAIAIQQAFATLNQEHPNRPIRVRIGLNAGEPILTEGRLFGTAVHTAFRICARAQPCQILVSEVVYQLAAGKGVDFVNRGRIALKGLPGRVRLYEVRWVDERQ
jgi:class 3 adenylate cyclase/DNA-binding CsgD family transcriptional regulator/tetratricopeptide (TPR) repeat protein